MIRLEPTTGLEPVTPSLPRTCAADCATWAPTNLTRFDHKEKALWSGRRDSNPQHRAWKARALPFAPRPLDTLEIELVQGEGFEPPKGTEPAGFTARCIWPLCHPCTASPSLSKSRGAGGGIRTHDLLITSQLLYHLSYTGTLLE